MFSKEFRPKSRVRHVDSPDLAVINSQAMTWLSDSRGAVCIQCGFKVPHAEAETMAAGIIEHRGRCS
jgi:hypothetical protein